MKLRYHPSLSYNGIRSWPPLWRSAKAPQNNQTIRGEIGVLQYAHATPHTRQCYLVMEHDKKQYVSCVFCSDAQFCTKLGTVLALKQNRTMAEIGDLEF
jgi:hypothetical protein